MPVTVSTLDRSLTHALENTSLHFGELAKKLPDIHHHLAMRFGGENPEALTVARADGTQEALNFVDISSNAGLSNAQKGKQILDRIAAEIAKGLAGDAAGERSVKDPAVQEVAYEMAAHLGIGEYHKQLSAAVEHAGITVNGQPRYASHISTTGAGKVSMLRSVEWDNATAEDGTTFEKLAADCVMKDVSLCDADWTESRHIDGSEDMLVADVAIGLRVPGKPDNSEKVFCPEIPEGLVQKFAASLSHGINWILDLFQSRIRLRPYTILSSSPITWSAAGSSSQTQPSWIGQYASVNVRREQLRLHTDDNGMVTASEPNKYQHEERQTVLREYNDNKKAAAFKLREQVRQTRTLLENQAPSTPKELSQAELEMDKEELAIMKLKRVYDNAKTKRNPPMDKFSKGDY